MRRKAEGNGVDIFVEDYEDASYKSNLLQWNAKDQMDTTSHVRASNADIIINDNIS